MLKLDWLLIFFLLHCIAACSCSKVVVVGAAAATAAATVVSADCSCASKLYTDVAVAVVLFAAEKKHERTNFVCHNQVHNCCCASECIFGTLVLSARWG